MISAHLTEVLLLLFLACIIIAGTYKTYFHFRVKKIADTGRGRKIKYVLNTLSMVLMFISLGIAAYIFIDPSKAASLKEEIPTWTDVSEPYVIIFEKPVRHESVTHEFSLPIKGTWKFEQANEFDMFYRKLVFLS